MPARHFIYVPGPTTIPGQCGEVMRAMIAGHRRSVLPTLSMSLFDDLQVVVPHLLLQNLNEQMCVCGIAGPGMAKRNIGTDKSHAALPPP